jgi:hypothetical protein
VLIPISGACPSFNYEANKEVLFKDNQLKCIEERNIVRLSARFDRAVDGRRKTV